MTDTRTKNSSRNIIFSMTAYLVQVVLGFLVRRYFIYYFNEEFLGLNSLFANILSILSLAELGFGTAIVFSMYKPMAENDVEKVKALLGFYRKCYMVIGVIVAVLGLLVLPFMPYFKTKAPNVDVNIYIVYLLFLANSVVSYFFAYRRSLLYANQRNDIESKINILIYIVQSVGQLLIILLLKNFYLYVVMIGISTVLNNFLVVIITQKKYLEFLDFSQVKLSDDERKVIKKNVTALIFHKVGEMLIYSTDSVLIYTLVGASALGKYSNYVLIVNYIGTIINLYINALSGSIGNSIASESTEKNATLFSKLNFIHVFICAFCTVCIFNLSDPFIDCILTKNSTTSLLLNKFTLFAICLSFYLNYSKNMVNAFKQGAGLFEQDKYMTLIEAGINLVASIVLAKFFGLIGIVVGTIISTLSISMWTKPYVLNKYYLKQSTGKYFLKYLGYTACMAVSGVVTYFVCSLIPAGGIVMLVLKFAVCGVVAGVTLLAGFALMPDFKQCFEWGKTILKNFKKRKATVTEEEEKSDV